MIRFALYTVTALTTSAIFAGAAHADDRYPQWYIGLGSGYNYMSNKDVNGNSAASDVRLNDGYVVSGSIGYLPQTSIQFLNSMRFEGEIVYHRNNVKGVDATAGGFTAGNGSYSTIGYMANAFYDFKTSTPWTPYVGLGGGIAEINLDANPGVGNTGGTNDQFAYQAMLGIGYTPSTIPDTQWTVGYRYFSTISDGKFSPSSGTGGNITIPYSSNSFELGAKFLF